jgi:hypothetical protein
MISNKECFARYRTCKGSSYNYRYRRWIPKGISFNGRTMKTYSYNKNISTKTNKKHGIKRKYGIRSKTLINVEVIKQISYFKT